MCEENLQIRLQKQLSNGRWVSIEKERTEEYFNIALNKQIQLNKEFGKKYADSKEKLLEMLKKNREIRYGDDWYANIRIKKTKEEKKAEQEQLNKGYERLMKYQKEQDEWYKRAIYDEE